MTPTIALRRFHPLCEGVRLRLTCGSDISEHEELERNDSHERRLLPVELENHELPDLIVAMLVTS